MLGRLRSVAATPQFSDGRYETMRAIGTGGMGRVFEARDAVLGRTVAVKVSHAPLAGDELDTRLRAEAEVLARLEHPGIVPVHDLGLLVDGRLFYVMKLVRGRTLADHAAQLPNESTRLSVFERIVEAVAFAHAQGVVHRDLKPENVMVGQFGEVLVMDWGVASLLAETGAHTHRVGTPGYMPPEQAEPHTAPHPTADVFALGAVLKWLCRDQPRMPRRLRAIIGKCLAASPADRYSDASALAADLARYRAGDAVDALPETIVDRALRFAGRHLTLILLLVAYLLMRAIVLYVRQ